MARKTPKAVYMKVTKDELELPVAVAETVKELSIMTGRSINAIRSSISKHEHGKLKRSVYVRVILDD